VALVLPLAVSEHYRAQQRLTVATLGLVRREWARMGQDFDASWAAIGPRLLVLTSAAQLGAARNGVAYVPAALSEVGQDVAESGVTNPRAFAGFASDGRPLGSLLEGAKVRAKEAQSLDVGGRWLDMVVQTQIADASRAAASVSIAARPKVGYVRMVNPPCCSRCAVLAGKFFRYNQGFQRHPRCDCTHIPTLVANPDPDYIGASPQELFRSGQVKGLTAGEHQAIADGADFSQVVNSHRAGQRSMTTSEGTTKRGLARERLGKGRQRLTPDAIYRLSSTRDEALRLLERNGYLL